MKFTKTIVIVLTILAAYSCNKNKVQPFEQTFNGIIYTRNVNDSLRQSFDTANGSISVRIFGDSIYFVSIEGSFFPYACLVKDSIGYNNTYWAKFPGTTRNPIVSYKWTDGSLRYNYYRPAFFNSPQSVTIDFIGY